ncbi:MAG: PilC/PilY family type IV pilus protein, partial [Burkholderiaceae bacterium]
MNEVPMSRLSIRPLWLGILALVVALGVGIRVAIALAAFVPANQPVGYVAQDEVTSFNLRSGVETLYRGHYDRERWSGGLFAYPVDQYGNVDIVGRRWDAGDQVDLQNFSTGRFIATMQDNGTAVPFALGNLSAAQQTALGNSTGLVNYLRGERTNEGATYRLRDHVLGDIIHSRPYYVGDATNPTVFVGANDGMLHALNASPAIGGGDERWAYIPSMLIPKLKNLASTATPFVHDYYVDGQINIATINSGATRALVGALGAGGKGLFALNITGSAGLAATSEAQVASKVMWEISPTGLNYASPTVANAYVNLGYTYGTVTMAKVGGVDAVIVGNGYNDGGAIGYGSCTPVAPAVSASYVNCGGNYAAYLYVINAMTGQLIKAVKVGIDGTALSPNGLSTPAAVDVDGDGSIDRVYAGDLNGSMWRIDLAAGTATELLATSPSQPITSTPGVAVHPNGGYMVTFGTGRMLTSADATDTSVYYAYGIWDGAPVANTQLLTQTLTERSYTVGGVTTRVRSVTANQPAWSSGALNHKGWKVALPAGERVIGEGSFIENQRFYFTSYDPTKTAPVIAGTTTAIKGENWLMELDYLSGGTKNQPFLDLSGDVILNDTDRIRYTASDTLPVTVPATAVGDPILTTDGIAVGKFISIGVMSQPILVQNVTLNDTLFNQNPDVIIPPVSLGEGVTGGHFDQDIYYRSGGDVVATQATATITVNTTGQTNPFPATLGAITVNGVTVVPAMSQTDIANGTASNTNATKIKSLVSGGFTATVAGNVVTIKAPLGSDYNGLALSIADGTSQTPLIPG